MTYEDEFFAAPLGEARPSSSTGKARTTSGYGDAAAADAAALQDTFGLHLWPASTCLVSELADALNRLSDQELRRTDVVLPTGRLSTWLLAMLADRRGAFVPPRCLTRDEFVARYARLVQGDAVESWSTFAVLTDLEEELLLAGLLKDGYYRHLGLGHAHEVRQLFAEIVAWDLDAEAWDRLAAAIAADIYHSEQGLGTLQERVDELRDLHGRYAATLESLRATTPRLKLRAASRSLAQHLASGGALGADRLYLAGFTSMEQMHAPMLHALARRPEAQIWITEPPTPKAMGTGDDPHPVQLLLKMIEQEPIRRSIGSVSKPPPFTVHRAPSVLAEVSHALDLCTEAIGAGLPPSAVALLVTDDKTYGKALRTLLPGCDFKANVALALPLAATLQGTWLTALLAYLGGDHGTPEILALLVHPLTGLVDGPGISRERVTGELLKSGVTGRLSALLASPTLSPETRQAVAALERLVSPLADAEGMELQPLAAWAATFAATVRPVLLDPGQHRSVSGDFDIGVALSTQAAVESFLTVLSASADRIDMPLGKREFLTLVGDRLLTQEVRSVGDPLCGVQILSVEEARYVPFDLVIVLGAAEGKFPRAVPRDYLLDNFLKTRIGLPGWQLAEAIEDTTFALLRARLPALALLYPATSGGEPVVRSRFIEGALVAGECHESVVDPELRLLARLKAAARSEATAPWQTYVTARSQAAGQYAPAARAPLASPMSASALESLIRCPYRFLLSRLGVSDLPWAEDDDARTEGDWLHDVLEAFFTGKTSDRPERQILEPLDGKTPWSSFRAYALDRLERLTAALAPAGAQDSETRLHLSLKAWPAFVTHLMSVYDERTLEHAGRGLREYRIGRADAPVYLRVGDSDVALTGLIDAVDRLRGGHLITDYKRNYAPDKRSVLDGVAPQLPLYALALAAEATDDSRPLRRAVIGYWSILSGTWEGVATGADAKGEAVERGLISGYGSYSKDGPAKDGLEGAAANLMDLWSWRHGELLGPSDGADVRAPFGPDPSRCDLCQLSGICRRDDPELGGQVALQDALNQRLKARRAPAAAVPGSGGDQP